MAGLLAEISIILALLFLNGVFAISQIAIVTARHALLEQRAVAGDAGARVALTLGREPTRFLSTVQLGITAVGTIAGAFGGATLAEEIAGLLMAAAVPEPTAEFIGFAIVVTGIV